MSHPNGVSNGMPDTQVPNKATEIGWTFVPQYYTCMNQDPSRLHCFYTKKSTLVHADEREDAQPSYGQQRFQALGFDNTKVYVSTVDSQASADGGIIIQVIGELSNKGGSWRKFSQTFFLAQQPNGYYVLNDIFRYLTDEDEESQTEDEPAVEQPQEPAKAPELAPEPAPEPAQEPAPKAAPEPAKAPAPATASAQPATQEAPAQPARKTWANLAASGAQKWAATPSAGSPGTAAATTQSAAPAPTAAVGKPRSTGAAQGTQVFVKNVTSEHAANNALKLALDAQFGATKECQVNTGKGFAFVEFVSSDAAHKAIAAGSLQVGSSAVQIEKRRGNERGGNTRGRGGRGGGRGGSSA